MEFQFSNRISGMRPSIIRELLKQMANPKLISFAGGNPDANAFPAEEIRRISDELLRDEAPQTLQYSITEGYPPLKAVGEEYLNSEWQVKKPGDDMIITSGSQQVMDLLTKLLCNEGDVVATEDPAFLGALGSFRSYGVRLAGVPMEEDGVNIEALAAVLSADEKPRFFYTIPNFQNPTGATTSLEKRKAIYALCRQHGVPILEDNPYGALRFSGSALPSIKSFDEEGLVVYAASLSKILAPGMRVAFCVGAPDVIAKMVVAKQGADVHTNLWAQRVCERFLCSDGFTAHLARLRDVYHRKAQHMQQAIDRELGSKVKYLAPKGGMFIWLTLPDAVNTNAFIKACLDRLLAIVPGSAFFVNDEQPCQSVRMNYSTPSFEQIDAGVRIMAQVLNEML